jgi:uncharacterized protein (DUF2235 family)
MHDFDERTQGASTPQHRSKRNDAAVTRNPNQQRHARYVSALSPEQRSYYEEILAAHPETDPAEALETAASSRKLTLEDQRALIQAREKIASMKPRRIDDGSNPNLVQLEISFDGTWNARDEMAFDTNAALVGELFAGETHYQKGVGTDPGTALIGGVTGAGISTRIDDAFTALVTKINELKRANPSAEVVLIIAGFSRGATAARAFANKLERHGIPDLSSTQTDGRHARHFETPRIGVMILFDTVGSVGIPGNNINPGLDLSIPASAENVLHLTARDEKRWAFPLSSAIDPTRPDDDRITEIELPGAHSDVGGSYPNRYSKLPLQIAHQYMEQRGVHVKPLEPGAVPEPADSDLRLHDSGAPLLDRKRAVYASQNR